MLPLSCRIIENDYGGATIGYSCRPGGKLRIFDFVGFFVPLGLSIPWFRENDLGGEAYKQCPRQVAAS